MMRSAGKLLFACLLAAASVIGGWLFYSHHSVEQELARQRERNDELRLIVQRLSAQRRVGDILVTNQSETAGVLHTTLLFVEYTADGTALPGRTFVIEGKMAHIDAMVIKFDGRFVQENDPLRGQSIALFTRMYGETQTPADGFRIDAPGVVPAIYKNDDPRVQHFQSELWANFWKLADDPTYRASMGVRVAQGEGVWRNFEPGWLYTLTLESNGGLNITADRVKEIYRQAMTQRPPTTQK